MTWHPLLARQLRRAQLDAAEVAQPYRDLFATIDAAYQQFDAERALLERTMDLNTEEQQHVHSEMRAVYERLIVSSLDGIFAIDLDGCCTVWNPVMERLTNINRLKILYQSPAKVFPQLLTPAMVLACQEVLTGKPVFIKDAAYRDAHSGHERFFDIQFTPLRKESGAIIGGLGVMHDITQRKVTHEAQQRQYAYLDAIQEMALRLNSPGELAELLAAITQRVGLLLATDDVFLTVFDADGSLVARHYGFGVFGAAIDATQESLVAGIAEVQRTGLPQLSNTVPPLLRGVPQWAIVPVFHGVHVAGVLGVARASSAAPFEVGEIAVVRQLAQLAAIALQQDALNAANARLASLATTDPLTGLPNHRDILDHLELMLGECRQQAQSCAVLFVDIDHFKTINDTWGHRAGDAVLREVSQRLAYTIRRDDAVGRYGGEEFLVLLQNVTPDEAARIAEDLRAVLCAQPVPWPTPHGLPTAIDISASMGIALYPHHGLTRDKLIEAADAAMYRAKREGRNRACFVTSATAKAA